MQKELEKFDKEFRKLQSKLKGYDPNRCEKIKQSLVDELEHAWDCEDEMNDALKVAIENGNKGKKPADFAKDEGFKSTSAAWRKATDRHKAQIKALRGYTDGAAALRDMLRRKFDPVQKAAKKDKKAASDKPVKAKLEEARKALTKLDDVVAVYGTLKMPELFYAAKTDRTLELLVKKAVKKSAPKELPKILEAGVGKKNMRKARQISKSVQDLLKQAAEARQSDPKKAGKTLKIAEKQLAELKRLNEGYKEAAKKQAKEIARAENAKELKRFIDEIASHCDAAEKAFEAARRAKQKAPA